MKRIIALSVVLMLVFFACSSGDGDGDGNIGNGDYYLGANIGNIAVSDGSLQLLVSRLDMNAAGANTANVTLNGTTVPLLLGSAEEATYVLNHIGYGPDVEYTLVVSIDGISSTCNFTIPGFDGITIESPEDDSPYTAGDDITVTWSFDGGNPPVILFHADDENEGSEPDSGTYDYEIELDGSATSHTIPGSVTNGFTGDLWIQLDPTCDTYGFTGNLHSALSGVVQVYEASWITLSEGGLGVGTPGHLSIWVDDTSLPADGVSTTEISVNVYDVSEIALGAGFIVNFSTTLGTITPTSVTDEYGTARATLTAPSTEGTAVIAASCETVLETMNFDFIEYIDVQISVGSGSNPVISWTPASTAAYAMSVGETGATLVPKWTLGSLTGFTSPVTYGSTPTGATQLVPMIGSPDPLESGHEYRITLVAEDDDTTFYVFTR